VEAVDSVRILTLVDNDVWQNGLKSEWGLSFYVETHRSGEVFKILMDTGSSFSTLSENSSSLGVPIEDVNAIFISHWHGDHCGAILDTLALQKSSTPVHAPSQNSSITHRIEEIGGIMNICDEPTLIKRGIMSTGSVGTGLSEHALMVHVKDKGLVVLVGCGHPGIIKIIKQAREASGVEHVYAVLGGFHNISSKNEIKLLVDFLIDTGAMLVSPCHCTAGASRILMEKMLGDRFVRNGSGKKISI
jgi:7,8-dihydropterin-6-yl-methyl-4-(beta-D-ribofuranosyl)aminobenzene 5'-phosphate synthase